jgi:hypothetical protein
MTQEWMERAYPSREAAVAALERHADEDGWHLQPSTEGGEPHFVQTWTEGEPGVALGLRQRPLTVRLEADGWRVRVGRPADLPPEP